MKVLRQDGSGVWQFDPYFAYLKEVAEQLPSTVAAYATRWEHYALDSVESLHDSWVEAIEIREPATGSQSEVRTTELIIRLLGSYHDRLHELIYRGVTRYRIDTPSGARGHGDLIVHEFRLGGDHWRSTSCSSGPKLSLT